MARPTPPRAPSPGRTRPLAPTPPPPGAPRPGRPRGVPFDGRRILTSDDSLQLNEIPKTLVVVGAGVIGCEYASIFAALGVRVTLIDKRDRLLSFVDREIVDALIYQLRQNRVTLRLGEEGSAIEPIATEFGDRGRGHLSSGKKLTAAEGL